MTVPIEYNRIDKEIVRRYLALLKLINSKTNILWHNCAGNYSIFTSAFSCDT